MKDGPFFLYVYYIFSLFCFFFASVYVLGFLIQRKAKNVLIFVIFDSFRFYEQTFSPRNNKKPQAQYNKNAIFSNAIRNTAVVTRIFRSTFSHTVIVTSQQHSSRFDVSFTNPIVAALFSITLTTFVSISHASFES